VEFTETAWKGFRNLKPRRQCWRSGLNAVVGPNGSGKTNLLESLAVLCGWGAFAGGRLSSLIQWNSCAGGPAGGPLESDALITGRAEGERSVEVQASITRASRVWFRVDGERATYSGLRFLLPSLVFLPRDIDLLDGSPSVRRLFLDRICTLISPLYARRLAEYRQIVRQRAALLRQPRPNHAALAATALPLVRFGGWIRATRQKVIDLLGKELLAEDLLQVSQVSQEHGLLSHALSIALVRREPGSVSPDPEEAAGEAGAARQLSVALQASLERERYARMPLVGPHRDDLLFSCMGRPAALSLSRGQKRRAVVATILAAGHVIRSQMRVSPILLLDDVAAELDAEGRRLMGRAFAATGWQVFLTGTENPFADTAGTIILLKNGIIENEIKI
jgi:DNA replication and repair protein RecF